MTSPSSPWFAAADGIRRVSRCASLAAVACFAACIAPSEWTAVGATIVVDEANGPGAHFTDIPAAVTAAAPGDLLLVRPGEYSPFLLNKAITIVGAPNGASRVSRPSSLPMTVVGGLPAGQVVAIAELGFPSALSVWGVHGTVALDGCEIGRLIGFNADDVRVNRAPKIGRVQVQGSHVEIVSSTVGGGVAVAGAYGVGTGWAGPVMSELQKEHIWPTVALNDQSKVLCASTSVRGRHVYIDVHGPNVWAFPFTHGTSACSVDDQSTLALIGTSADVVRGGDSGPQPSVIYSDGALPVQFGWGGNAIDLESGQVAHSGVQLLGGTGVPITDSIWVLVWGITTTDGKPVAGADASKLVAITPDNPTLELLDTPIPSSKARLRVRGPANSQVTVEHGTPTIVAVSATRPIETLVTAVGSVQPGAMPSTGELTFDLDIDPAVGKGWHVFLQARLVLPNGAVRVSNSVLLVAR